MSNPPENDSVQARERDLRGSHVDEVLDGAVGVVVAAAVAREAVGAGGDGGGAELLGGGVGRLYHFAKAGRSLYLEKKGKFFVGGIVF